MRSVGGVGMKTVCECLKDINKEELELIVEIANKVTQYGANSDYSMVNTIVMDLTFTHMNSCRLKLHELLNADEFDIKHDVFGIINNLCRDTGELLNCFYPRYAE